MTIAPNSRSRSPKNTNANRQVAVEGSFELDASADSALAFFTPEGERAWVKGWNPKPVYPPQAEVAFQANSVFRVDQAGERSLWTIIGVGSQEHTAEYVCVVQGVRLSRVRVEVEPLGSRRCRVRVRYVHTGTSEKGLDFVAGITDEAFAQKMRDWQRMVSAAMR